MIYWRTKTIKKRMLFVAYYWHSVSRLFIKIWQFDKFLDVKPSRANSVHHSLFRGQKALKLLNVSFQTSHRAPSSGEINEKSLLLRSKSCPRLQFFILILGFFSLNWSTYSYRQRPVSTIHEVFSQRKRFFLWSDIR